MKKKTEVDNDRRRALKALGGSVVAGTVVAATATAGAAQASTPVDVSSQDSKSLNGYHETQHIRDYYDSL